MRPKQGGCKKETALQRFWKRNCAFVGGPKARGSGHAQDNGSSEGRAFPSLSEKQWSPHTEFEGE